MTTQTAAISNPLTRCDFDEALADALCGAARAASWGSIRLALADIEVDGERKAAGAVFHASGEFAANDDRTVELMDDFDVRELTCECIRQGATNNISFEEDGELTDAAWQKYCEMTGGDEGEGDQ